MKTISVREYRDKASSILAGGEALVIERHGELIGFLCRLRLRTAGPDAR